MKNLLMVLVAILMAVVSVSAQSPDTLWTKTYGTSAFEICYDIEKTNDGNYIVVGSTGPLSYGYGDVWLFKTDSDGDTLWSKTYSRSNYDAGYCVRQTSDGGYIIAGESGFDGVTLYSDIWLIKTDANGDTLWTKTYGGTYHDNANCLELTSDDGYIVVGETNVFSNTWGDIWLLKLNTNGDTLWTRTFGGNNWDYGKSVKQTADGGYVVIGTYGLIPATGHGGLWLIKTDANGDTLWTRLYDGSNWDYGYDVLQNIDGGYMLLGTTGSFVNFYHDIWLIKTDSNGDSLWSKTYGGEQTEIGRKIKQTSDDGYIIIGETNTYGYGYPNSDVWLVKTDANGDSLWTQTYGGQNWDRGHDIEITTDNGYIIAGLTYSFGNGYGDGWLIRLGDPILTNLTPHSPPIQIPSGGGSFQFDIQITNQSQTNYNIDIWTDITLPGGATYPIIVRSNMNLPVGASITRNDLTQFVPATALPGNYSYNAHVRDHNTWQVLAEDSFLFEKLAGDNTPNHDMGWSLLGWDEAITQTTPAKFALLPNHPNPFNPTTNISFTLPEVSRANLTVYDLAGRQIAELTNKFLEVGTHQYMFDGTNLASGVYLVKLQAGEYRTSQKIILLK